MTFTNDHPYNQATWFIRNMFLVFFSQNLFTKTLYFFGISLGLLSLSVTEFATKWGSLLFPVTFFYLLPFGLVEQRYYFIPIAVYLLVSKPVEKRIEYAQIVYWFILTFILFDGIVKLKFFL
jgi:hypothetical protein